VRRLQSAFVGSVRSGLVGGGGIWEVLEMWGGVMSVVDKKEKWVGSLVGASGGT
jgi:hypothetical protein